MTWKDINPTNYQDFILKMRLVISNLYEKHEYLLKKIDKESIKYKEF